MPADNHDFNTEALWDQLLSRQQDQIRKAYYALTATERKAVLNHLIRMSSEAGWHEEQRVSAQAALQVIADR
jgi:hypothetical protein